MTCYHPKLVLSKLKSDGKQELFFKHSYLEHYQRRHYAFSSIACGEDYHESPSLDVEMSRLYVCGDRYEDYTLLKLPCGNCVGCRIQRSQDWAIRCYHESKMHDENCFVTLTFSSDNLPSSGSISRQDCQKFIRSLRKRTGKKIRYFYCGEYGGRFQRPHYHFCLFGYSPSDKKYLKTVNKQSYYISDEVSAAWNYKGYVVVGDVTFQSAAYVGRYVTKKIVGSFADEHYQGRTSEFSQPSLKPGLGSSFLEVYGQTDVFQHDKVVVQGKKYLVPRYYDKYLEKIDPEGYVKMKAKRIASALKNALRSDEIRDQKRLEELEFCFQSRINQLIRPIEV